MKMFRAFQIFLIAIMAPLSAALSQSKLEIDLLYKSSVFEELRDQQRFLDKNIAQSKPWCAPIGKLSSCSVIGF
jgi:hypothetical protein